MTEAQLRATLSQISLAGVAALDEMLASGGPGESFTLGDSIADPEEGPTGIFEAKEMRETLAKSIRRMPERERLVLTLYYFEGLTLAAGRLRRGGPVAWAMVCSQTLCDFTGRSPANIRSGPHPVASASGPDPSTGRTSWQSFP